MSILQYVFSLLVVLTVAIEAKKILRAQAGAATTGNFMVVLDKGVSSERFRQLVQLVGGNAEDQKVYSQVDGMFAKVITAKLSEEALEKVRLV